MFVGLKVQDLESSSNKDFLKRNDVLDEMKKLKIIQSSVRSVVVIVDNMC
jgi:hypothetical protein